MKIPPKVKFFTGQHLDIIEKSIDDEIIDYINRYWVHRANTAWKGLPDELNSDSLYPFYPKLDDEEEINDLELP